MPAFQEFGFGFLTAQSWNPVTEKFGALAPIYGTIMTSLIAMLIAVPFGLMIAMFLTELCPLWLRRPIGIAIELLAGIPSIIYGIWGLFVFAPVPAGYMCNRRMIAAFENVPVLSTIVRGAALRDRILTASLILAIMVLPFITSISRDVFDAVPPVLEGSGLRPRLDPMGSLALRCASVHPHRRHRRRHAGAGARSAKPWRSLSSSATRTGFRPRCLRRAPPSRRR